MPGIIERYTKWLHAQWPAGTVEKLPVSGVDGVTAQPGVRIVGDLTGIPLLKFSSHTGANAVRAILREPNFSKPEIGNRLQRTRSDGQAFKPESYQLDLAIIGAGLPAFRRRSKQKKGGT